MVAIVVQCIFSMVNMIVFSTTAWILPEFLAVENRVVPRVPNQGVEPSAYLLAPEPRVDLAKQPTSQQAN